MSRSLLWVLVGAAVLQLAVTAEEEGYVSYDGYKLIKATPNDENQLEVLRNLVKRDLQQVEVWKEPSVTKRSVDIFAGPEAKDEVLSVMKDYKINHVINDKISELLNVHRRRKRSVIFNYNNTSEFSVGEFHTYDEIMLWLHNLQAAYPRDCIVSSIGRTYENRDLKLIQIGNTPGKDAVWIDAGIHAREWAAPAASVYIIDMLLKQETREARFLRNNYNFYIVPVLNPDGYDYTWQSNRLWRKNRGPTIFFLCKGTDINRNFGYKWGGKGTSKNPCVDTYRGDDAFSENEAQAVRDKLIDIKYKVESEGAKFAAYITLHSYGQYILMPWGYDRILSRDHDDLMKAAEAGAYAIKRVHGSIYRSGNSAILLYPAAGGSDDYAKHLGIKYAYTIELRDQGNNGFILPEEEIIPTSEELFAGIHAMIRTIKNEGRTSMRRWRHI